MANDEKTMPKLGRRDSLKLATAVTALGAGLGVVLDAGDAVAGETIKLRSADLGGFTIKLYKLDGAASTLLETIDVGALSLKMSKGGAYAIKMYNHKLDTPAMLLEQGLAIEPAKLAPVAPAPIQAPAPIKR